PRRRHAVDSAAGRSRDGSLVAHAPRVAALAPGRGNLRASVADAEALKQVEASARWRALPTSISPIGWRLRETRVSLAETSGHLRQNLAGFERARLATARLRIADVTERACGHGRLSPSLWYSRASCSHCPAWSPTAPA